MTDLADLAMRVRSEDVETANKRLDQLPEKAAKAERATDQLGTASDRTGGAIAQLIRQVEAAVREQSAMINAHLQTSRAAQQLSADTTKAAVAQQVLAKATAQADAHVTAYRAHLEQLGRSMAQQNAHVIAYREHLEKINKTLPAAATNTKAMTQATLNLSRQFADIGVTAAMGMSPLMIMIQQGPQIADAFMQAKTQGVGFSAVMRSMASTALNPLVIAGGALAGVVLVLAAAFLKGSTESAELQNSLKATGNYAGVTSVQLQGMITTIGESTGYFGAAREAIVALSASGKVSGDNMEKLGSISVRISRLTGQTAGEVAKQWSAMGDDVAGFATKANAQLHFLSAAQLEHIRLMEQEGRGAEAMAELINKAHESISARGDAELGILQRAWDGVTRAIGGAWENLKKFGAGGDQGVQNRIDSINTQLNPSGQRNPLLPEAVGRLERERDALQELLNTKQEDARLDGERARTEQAGSDAARRHAETYATMGDNLARVNRELSKYRSDQEAMRKADPNHPALDSPARAAQIEAEIRKRNMPSERRSAQGPQDRSDSVTAAAERDYTRAQIALTKDVEALAALKKQEVAVELRGQQAQLARQLKDGSITASAAEIADSYYRQAAGLKANLIDLETKFALDQQALAHAQAMAGYADREAQARMGLGVTVEERNLLEAEMMARRHKLELDGLENTRKQQAAMGQAREAALTEEQIAAAKRAQQSEDELAQRQRQQRTRDAIFELEDADRQNAIDILNSQASINHSSYRRSVIQIQILKAEQELERLRLEEIRDSKTADPADRERARRRLKALEVLHENDIQAAEAQLKLSTAYNEAADRVRAVGDAFKRRDWPAVFDAVQDAFLHLRSALSSGATSAERISSMAGAASAVGGMIGGRAGRGIAGGLGLAASGIWAGGSLAGGALAGTIGTGLGGGALGAGVASFIAGPLAAAMPWIGAIAGLVMVAKALQKPSNKGAGYDLTTGQFSGQSRDEETEAAVKQAGDVIQQMQDVLEGAGVTLSDKIRGLVIGSRDQSQIYTTGGKTIYSAKGDPAAAAEAAFQALLDGADYVSETQRKLVEDMRAAGKGFEDIATALQGYAAAQKITDSLADAILGLKDPDAYDRLMLSRTHEARRAEAKAAFDAGYVTADQLAAINLQLKELEGLEVAELMKSKLDQVTEAFNRQAAELQGVIDKYRQVAASLRDFAAGLSSVGVSPADQYANTRAAFSQIQARIARDDVSALDSVQGVSNAFLEASLARAPDALSYARDRASVQKLAKDAAALADAQANIAEEQLLVMRSQYETLLSIDANLLTFGESVTNFLATLGSNENAAAKGQGAVAAQDQNELLQQVLLALVAVKNNTGQAAYVLQGATSGAMTLSIAEAS